VLRRNVFPVLPAGVEFDLTALGTGLADILAQLRDLNAAIEKETPPPAST
jgi:DNA-binding HxlR family transcriptional regulator